MSLAASPLSGPGVHKTLGGDTAGTAGFLEDAYSKLQSDHEASMSSDLEEATCSELQ